MAAETNEFSPGDRSLRKVLPQRSKTYGVGKQIGGAVYVHRRYEAVFGSVIEQASRHLPPDFDYAVVKYNLANRAVSFVQVADFDAAPEPTVGTVIVVKTDGSCRTIHPPDDPYIYHHKWLFVRDDYDGFCVDESRQRSAAWLGLPDVDKRRIGKRSYWMRYVVPRLRSGGQPVILSHVPGSSRPIMASTDAGRLPKKS